MRIAPTCRAGRWRFAGSSRETLPGDRAGAIKKTGFGHERGKSLVPRHGLITPSVPGASQCAPKCALLWAVPEIHSGPCQDEQGQPERKEVTDASATRDDLRPAPMPQHGCGGRGVHRE